MRLRGRALLVDPTNLPGVMPAKGTRRGPWGLLQQGCGGDGFPEFAE